MGTYWKSVFGEAWRAYKARLREGRRHLIAFIIQTVLLLAILFYVPWFGQLQDEARLVAATVGAVLTSSFLVLVFEFLKAPSTLHSRLSVDLVKMRNHLRFDQDVEGVKRQGYEIYEGWVRAMPTGGTLKDNFDEAEVFEKQASDFIQRHYSSTEYMSYQYGMGYSVEQNHAGTPLFYTKRLDRVHTILLSHWTVAQENNNKVIMQG